MITTQIFLHNTLLDDVWRTQIMDWILPDTKISNWGLPSHGISRHDCGEYFMMGCDNIHSHPDNKGYFKPSTKRCYRPVCPICWINWLHREAQSISDRLSSFTKRGKPIHVTVSVSSKEWFRNPSKLKRKAYKMALKVGVLGGSIIFHPARQKEYSRMWYFSPHFHIFGFGWIDGHLVKENYEKSGWIIKNIGIRKTVYGTAYYQLSHAGVYYGNTRKHNITWFGALSYNKISKKLFTKSHSLRCPYCGNPLRTLIWNGTNTRIYEPLPCNANGYLADFNGWVDKSLYYYNFM